MVEVYPAALVVLGLAIFGAAVLPRLLSEWPLTLPIIYVGGGYLLFALPHGIEPPGVIEHAEVVERLTEVVVIVALMGAGMKIDRPFSWREWSTTWRLLAVTMPLTVGAAVVLGWYVLGLSLATAVLLGAVVAPTDPVLASDVDAGPPLSSVEEADVEGGAAGGVDAGAPTGNPSARRDGADGAGADGGSHPESDTALSGSRPVRFALTSEAGLNDGLAFPFTNLAIALAGVTVVGAGTGELAGVAAEWLLVDVAYRIAVGVVGGLVLGYAGAILVFRLPASTHVARALSGAEALSGTFVIYGATELVGGYGFLAVFVGALVLRRFEWEHDYYRTLHDFAVVVERIVLAVVLVGFGGALAGGLLGPLTATDALVGLALVVLVRPAAGIVGLLGSELSWGGRGIVAAYGIRGIGSFYYLSHALNQASFREFELIVAADRLWALVGFVVLVSIVLHGITASSVMEVHEETVAVRN